MFTWNFQRVKIETQYKEKDSGNSADAAQIGVIECDGALEVTGKLTEYPDRNTKYWVTEYANVGSCNTCNISKINDADVLIAFDEP